MTENNKREIIHPGEYAGVLLPLIFREPFDYLVPEGLEVSPGDYVHVPFGKKFIWGVVWQKGLGNIEKKKIKKPSLLQATTHI